MLEKAKSDDVDIVFITDDQKNDWWHQFKGKTIGPHPHLVQEFFDYSGRMFHIYSLENFTKYASKYLKQKVAKSAMDEISTFSRSHSAPTNQKSNEDQVEEIFKHRRWAEEAFKSSWVTLHQNQLRDHLTSQESPLDELAIQAAKLEEALERIKAVRLNPEIERAVEELAQNKEKMKEVLGEDYLLRALIANEKLKK